MLRGVVSDSEAAPPPTPTLHSKDTALSNHCPTKYTENPRMMDMYADAEIFELFRATFSTLETRLGSRWCCLNARKPSATLFLSVE